MTQVPSNESLPNRQTSEKDKKSRTLVFIADHQSESDMGTPAQSGTGPLSPVNRHSRSPRILRVFDDVETHSDSRGRSRTPSASPRSRGTAARSLSPLPGARGHRKSRTSVPGEASSSPTGSDLPEPETPASASEKRCPATPSPRVTSLSLPDAKRKVFSQSTAISVSSESPSSAAKPPSVTGRRVGGAPPSSKNELLQSFAHMLLAMRSQRVAFGWQLSQVQRLVEQLSEIPNSEALPLAPLRGAAAPVQGGEEKVIATQSAGAFDSASGAAVAGHEQNTQLHASQPSPNSLGTFDKRREAVPRSASQRGAFGTERQESILSCVNDEQLETSPNVKGVADPGNLEASSRFLVGSEVRTSVGPSTRDEANSFSASQLDSFSLLSAPLSNFKLGGANLRHPGASASPQSRKTVHGSFGDFSQCREEGESLLGKRRDGRVDAGISEARRTGAICRLSESAPHRFTTPRASSELSRPSEMGTTAPVSRGSTDLQSLERRIQGIRQAIELGMQFEDAYETITAELTSGKPAEARRTSVEGPRDELRRGMAASSMSLPVPLRARDSARGRGGATEGWGRNAGSDTDRPLDIEDLTVVVTPARDSHSRRKAFSRIAAISTEHATEAGECQLQTFSHRGHGGEEHARVASPRVELSPRRDFQNDGQPPTEAPSEDLLRLVEPPTELEDVERRQRTRVASERLRFLQLQMHALEVAREQLFQERRLVGKSEGSARNRPGLETFQPVACSSEASSKPASSTSPLSEVQASVEQRRHEKREWMPCTRMVTAGTDYSPVTRRRVQHPDERLLPPPQGESPRKLSPSGRASNSPGGRACLSREKTRTKSQHRGGQTSLLYPSRFLADMMRDATYDLRHPRSSTRRATDLSRRLALRHHPSELQQPLEECHSSRLGADVDAYTGSRVQKFLDAESYVSISADARVPNASEDICRGRGPLRLKGAKCGDPFRNQENEKGETDRLPPAGLPSPIRGGRVPGPPPPLRHLAGSATPSHIVTRPPFGNDFNAAWMNERIFVLGDSDCVSYEAGKRIPGEQTPAVPQRSPGAEAAWGSSAADAVPHEETYFSGAAGGHGGKERASIGVYRSSANGVTCDSRGNAESQDTQEAAGRFLDSPDPHVDVCQRVHTLFRDKHRSAGGCPTSVEQYPRYVLYSGRENAHDQQRMSPRQYARSTTLQSRSVTTRTLAHCGSCRGLNRPSFSRATPAKDTLQRTAGFFALRQSTQPGTSSSRGARSGLQEKASGFATPSRQLPYVPNPEKGCCRPCCTRKEAASQYPAAVDSVASLSWVKSLRSDRGTRNQAGRSATPNKWRLPGSTPAPWANTSLELPPHIKSPAGDRKRVKSPQVQSPGSRQQHASTVHPIQASSCSGEGRFALARHERINVVGGISTVPHGRKQRDIREDAAMEMKSRNGDSDVDDQTVDHTGCSQPVHLRLRVHIPPEHGSNLRVAPPLTVRRLDPTTHQQFFEKGQKYLNKLSLELPEDRTIMAVVSEGDIPVAVVRVRLTDEDSTTGEH
ncbi:hypothetical protein TGCAST_253140 [Toxoplasma gondii CAST]|uniref:Uncharacterized protein n=1 Tax=Toxoplasma gondii CAST TaxID=943122 RepID=A0A425HRH1_TOXGO|nr:hypothetical protein TGCAST_253140 [Toxoplasma gondii CAST]